MMKKIILSTVVAGLMATNSFAGSADANITEGPTTYNTVYTATLSGDVNASAMTFNYVSGADLLVKNIVKIKLDTGATFLGTASDWTLDNAGATVGTGVSMNATKDELQIRMGIDVAAGTAMTLINDVNDVAKANFALNLSATTDLSANITARDNESGIDLTDAAASVVLFDAQSYTVSGSITCDNVVIDSSDKTQFLASSTTGSQTHQAVCQYNIPGATSIYDIDFDYTDVNVTTVIQAGNLNDGNFTASGDTTGTPVIDANSQTFMTATTSLDHNTSAEDYNTTFTYYLDSANANILTSTTFPINSTIEFNANADVQQADLVDQKMEWTLSTYLVEILGMKNNPANNVSTNIKLYNKDSKAAVVDATVTLEDGSDTYTLTNIATVPANGSKGVSAADITAAAIAAGHASPANGYKVILSYQDTDKTDGNTVATQRNADGTYGIRINDNGDNAKNATGHQGL